MSQMQKFNQKIVEQVVSQLEILSSNIGELLNKQDGFSLIREKLDSLLNEREKYIELYKQFHFDNDIKKLFSINHNHWPERISRILEQENSNMRIIESNLKKLTEEIKNFNRQKSLMIYSKGQ